MASFWKGNRRKFPVVNLVLNVTFIASLTVIVFWVSGLSAQIQVNTTVQESVLDSNLKFNAECKSIKKDMTFIRSQLTIIQTCLLGNNE